MKIILTLLFTFLMAFSSSDAQNRIPGTYDPDTHTFTPDSPDVEIIRFFNDRGIVKIKGQYRLIDQYGQSISKGDRTIIPLAEFATGLTNPIEIPNPDENAIHILHFTSPSIQDIQVNSVCMGSNGGVYALVNEDGDLLVQSLLVWSTEHSVDNMPRPKGFITAQIYDRNITTMECIRCGHCYGSIVLLHPSGQLLVEPDRYSHIRPFFSGRAQVLNMEGKFGYIDEAGREVIPCTYTKANDFKDGVAEVQLNNQKFKIDPDGNRLSE